MATQIGPILTLTDLDVMPDDGNHYELIEGELLVSRAPSITHQIISGNIFSAIRGYLDHNPFGIVVATPGVIFDDFNSLIPDLIFMSNSNAMRPLRGSTWVVPRPW